MNQEFEKYARQELDQFEVPIDTEALWLNIEPIVQPKKDNRRIIWFFFSGLLIGAVAISLFFNRSKINVIESTDTSIITTTNSSQTLAAADPSSPVAPEVILQKDGIKQQTDHTPIKETNNQAKKQSTLYTSRPGAITEKAGFKSSVQSTDTELNNAEKLKDDAIVLAGVSKGLNVENDNVIPKKPTETGSSLVGIIEDSEEENDRGISKVLITENEMIPNRWEQALIPFSSFLSPVESDKRFASATDVIEGIKARNNAEMLATKEKAMAEAKAAAAKNKSKKRRGSFLNDIQFGLGLYGGISRSTTELDPRGVQNTEYELLRVNSEKQLETLHAGLNALIVSEQNLYLRTGVEYTRIGSLFSRSSERVETDSVPGIVEIQINQVTGDTNFIEGNLLRTKTTRYIKKSYNYFHLVDVPIILGYNFGSEPLTFGVEAGIYANIMIKSKGEIFQEDGDFYDKGEDPNGWYKNNLGISPFIGCNVSYHLNDNLRIHFSPGFRFPSVFSTSTNPLQERHANLGVQAGVRYIFDNY